MNRTELRGHEDLGRQHEVKRGSDRAFGLVFGVLFAGLAAYGWWSTRFYWPWATAGAVVFAVLGFAAPSLLAPLNRAWFRLGLLLNRIVNPLVMAFLFFGVVVPIGLALRIS